LELAMTLDPSSILGRFTCLLLAALMPLCCCTVQVLGDALGASEAASVVERPACCCGGATTCSTDDEDAPANPEGCHCVRTAPLLDSPSDQLMHTLTLPAPLMVAWTTATGETPRSADVAAAVACHGPPDDDGPPASSARRLRRAVILQV
jgi:hypothetical protein